MSAMNLDNELGTLRRHLDDLASTPDESLVERYELKPPPLPPGLYWQGRLLLAKTLHLLKLAGILPHHPWPVAMKHAAGSVRSKPLLLWAIGAERDLLRRACVALQEAGHLRGFVPVVITDVADFAFFTRIGWLVEYVPSLSGEGILYENRKARFLARLYRDAPALSPEAAVEMPARKEEIQRWLLRRSRVKPGGRH
jgi:hypothetical protein